MMIKCMKKLDDKIYKNDNSCVLVKLKISFKYISRLLYYVFLMYRLLFIYWLRKKK